LTGGRGVGSTGVVDATAAAAANGGVGAISVAFNADHVPAMSYYDGILADLKFASFSGKVWSTATIAAKRLQGRYNFLSFDPATGQTQILYWNQSGDSIVSAVVRKSGWSFATAAEQAGTGLTGTRATSGNRAVVWLK